MSKFKYFTEKITWLLRAIIIPEVEVLTHLNRTEFSSLMNKTSLFTF